MKVRDIARVLSAEILCGEELLDTVEVKAACGSDMMSDVLAFVKDQCVLLTGLVNPQVIRTAEMMDIRCVVFVRGKNLEHSVLNLAEARDLVIMRTDYRMFTACGRLYEAGLRGGDEPNG